MDNKQLSAKLKASRLKEKLSLQDVADFLAVNKSTVSRWEKGLATPSKATLASLCSLYSIGLDFFDDSEAPQIAGLEPFEAKSVIPVIGVIAAGLPLYAEENIEGYVASEKYTKDRYFSLRVRGDSMNAARIEDGDRLIIRRQDFVENGEIAAVMVDNDNATVKKFYQKGDTVMLIPMSKNPAHKIQVYDLKETSIRIIGKVVQNNFEI